MTVERTESGYRLTTIDGIGTYPPKKTAWKKKSTEKRKTWKSTLIN